MGAFLCFLRFFFSGLSITFSVISCVKSFDALFFISIPPAVSNSVYILLQSRYRPMYVFSFQIKSLLTGRVFLNPAVLYFDHASSLGRYLVVMGN